MSDFVADDGAKFGVGGFFLIAVTGAAEIEARAIADVALVFIRLADEAVIAVFRFHDWRINRRTLGWQ